MNVLSYFRFILFCCGVFNLFSDDQCNIVFDLITKKDSNGLYLQGNEINIGRINVTKADYTAYKNSGGGKKSAIGYLKNKLKSINLSDPAKAHLKLENLNNVALNNIKIIYIAESNNNIIDVVIPAGGELRNSEILQSEDNLVDGLIMRSFNGVVDSRFPSIVKLRNVYVYCYIETSKTQSPKTDSKGGGCCSCCKK